MKKNGVKQGVIGRSNEMQIKIESTMGAYGHGKQSITRG